MRGSAAIADGAPGTAGTSTGGVTILSSSARAIGLSTAALFDLSSAERARDAALVEREGVAFRLTRVSEDPHCAADFL